MTPGEGDVSDSRRMCESAREAHASIPTTILLHALDSLSLGVVLFGEDRKIIFCNQRYREIYGFSVDDVKPGTPTSRLIQRRLELGLRVQSDADQYVRERTTQPITATDAIHEFADGRVI